MKLPIPLPQLKKKLVDDRLITPERFDALVERAERKKQDVGDVLAAEQVADTDYLTTFVAASLGVETANLVARHIDEKAIKLLPEEIARQRQAIVFGREEDGTLDVAMLDPSDLEAIEFLSRHLNAHLKPFLATDEDLNRGFSIYGFESAGEYKKIIEENVQASLRTRSESVEEAAAQLPVVAIIDNLVSYAVSLSASDIHLEVLEESTLVRYRVDGLLYEVMRVPKAIHAAIVARIKLLSGLKLDEHKRPQDGRFRHRVGHQVIDIRVAVMPTTYGEKVVMRLLAASQKPLSLRGLGMTPDIAKVVARNLDKAYGMILVCGPTGSGKSTTLYGVLGILNRSSVNIVTIEDPIEYNMQYINQTQVNPEAGVAFASGLKAFLRQDPDIIMVGEIRDGDTANIAVQAALTGHLLLSSLHTSDAPTAVPRLFDLGVPPFLLASTLNVIIAQRLVRKVCQRCVHSYEPDEDILRVVRAQLKAIGSSMQVPRLFYRAKGCDACNGTGYKGRIGIFEVLEFTDELRSLIASPEFSLERLREAAHSLGMRTMFEDGLAKVELAITTVDEVLRVIRE